MTETNAATAAEEWRRYYTLPIAAAVGYATSVIHIYGLGPFIAPISEEFGWSRTLTTSGLTIATTIQAFLGIPIGFLVDRIGPRRLGIASIPLICAVYMLLGTTTGDKANWFMLWTLLAGATLPAQATIWTSAVATRFETSRGLAFAITLCGASLAATLFPPLATWLIEQYGWRHAFAIQGGTWVLLAFPVIVLFFRGARDEKQPVTDRNAGGTHKPLEGTSFLEGLRSTIYIRLLVASLFFTFTILALVVHFVPILTGSGASALDAAGFASLIGIFSIIGRLATGLLLDRFRGNRVGAAVFLLPAASSLLLLTGGDSVTSHTLAAVFIGLTLGAEVDVVVYLTTRYFGLRSFGALYGGLLAALSIGTATGPLAASMVYDQSGSYAPFLSVTILFMAVSSLAMLSLPKPVLQPTRL